MNSPYNLKDGTSYVVRRANEQDLDKLMSVLLKVAEEDNNVFLTYQESKKQILEAKERIKILLEQQDENFIYLIGLVENEIIAFCDIHIGKNQRDKHVAEFGRSVLKEWRRTGAGKIIQQAAILFVKNLKTVEKIKLNILSNNISSIESCKSNGFIEEARHKKELKFEDGTYVDLITYSLNLCKSDFI